MISSLNHELNYQIKLSSSSVPIDKELRHFRNETIKVNHALLNYVERTFELLSDNKIHHNIELDEITQNHFKIIDTLILPWIEELHFVKVLFYGEDDYNESDSISLLVENNTLSSTIDIKNSKTRKVKIITLNKAHILTIKDLRTNKHRIKIEELKTNCSFSEENILVFENTVPFIEFDIPSSEILTKKIILKIEFEYQSNPKELLQLISQIKKDDIRKYIDAKLLSLENNTDNNLRNITNKIDLIDEKVKSLEMLPNKIEDLTILLNKRISTFDDITQNLNKQLVQIEEKLEKSKSA